MRITGGNARGIPLKAPKGERTRPATDASRQALFSSLGPCFDWESLSFLDLFAGTGAYGLEAWSRGAQSGVFVEKDRMALQCLQNNLNAVARSLDLPARSMKIGRQDVLKWVPPDGMAFDLIFVDPPYEIIPDIAAALFSRLAKWLKADGSATVVFEAPGEWAYEPTGWEEFRRLGKAGKGPSIRFLRVL